jgi:hypothetical protein
VDYFKKVWNECYDVKEKTWLFNGESRAYFLLEFWSKVYLEQCPDDFEGKEEFIVLDPNTIRELDTEEEGAQTDHSYKEQMVLFGTTFQNENLEAVCFEQLNDYFYSVTDNSDVEAVTSKAFNHYKSLRDQPGIDLINLTRGRFSQ